jgi:phytoene desaturase
LSKKKVIIIGAGIAGLSSAVRMLARGYDVHVYEASDRIGGKMHEFDQKGYRFDAGPSLFTMPQYVTSLFDLLGEKYQDHFSYYNLPTVCNYFWDDKTRCSTYESIDKTIDELSTKLNEKRLALEQHFEDSKLKYQLTGKTFLEFSLHKLKTWVTKDVLKALLRLPKLDLLTTMHAVNEKRFSNPKTTQLFDRYATYNGSNPYKAPGLLNIIPHFEYGFGAYLPHNGMSQISQSIYQLAKRHGAIFHFNSKVAKIKTENGLVSGVKLANGESLSADLVITNMDAYFTYLHLLENNQKAKKVLRQERSSSALIFYWGVKRQFDQLDVHNIFFSNDYKAEFDKISQDSVTDDPTVYINITSKLIKSDAPDGCENWFVMINVPYNNGQDWDQIIVKSRENIIKKLNKNLDIDLASIIENESILDPRSIESKTQSYTGSLYGTSSNTRMAAFARHPNQTKDYKNLYFVGGSVHPGGGVPLCLLSSKIVDDLIHDQ